MSARVVHKKRPQVAPEKPVVQEKIKDEVVDKKMSGYMPKSKSDKWMTPPEVKDPLYEEFNLKFDPCPIDWKEGDRDGLSIDWVDGTFVNPPYSNTAKWIIKASEEHKKNKTVVMLINAITDTVAFHEHIYQKPNVEVRFLKGRIKFINPNEPEKRAPNVKGSMIVIFKADKKEGTESEYYCDCDICNQKTGCHKKDE